MYIASLCILQVYTSGCTSHTSGLYLRVYLSYLRMYLSSSRFTVGQEVSPLFSSRFTVGQERLSPPFPFHCWARRHSFLLFPFHCWARKTPPSPFPVSLLGKKDSHKGKETRYREYLRTRTAGTNNTRFTVGQELHRLFSTTRFTVGPYPTSLRLVSLITVTLLRTEHLRTENN